MPRSGSTLVEQILASHPQIQAAGESRELEKLAGFRANRQGSSIAFPQYLRTLDRAAVRELGEAYIRSLPACPDGVTCITDKLPGNFIYIGLIRTILPNARIIHTVRDPVETCMSCYSKPFDRGHHFSYDLGELGRYYRGYHELMKHWKSVLPAGVMLEVSYEDVVKDLDGQARRLIEYCGLDWDDRCLAFHKHRREIRTASVFQVRQPLYRSSLDRWRRYEAAIGPLLHELRHLTAGSSARAGAEGG